MIKKLKEVNYISIKNKDIWYVKDERFVHDLPMELHKAQYTIDSVLNFLESLNIPINDCCEQSYNNSADMTEKYSDL